MALYNDKVMEYFMNPHNVEKLKPRTARELMEARSAGI